jgi:hypothetical protein
VAEPLTDQQLADELEAEQSRFNCPCPVCKESKARLTAAAVRLREADEERRQLDAIRDAVGDAVREIRGAHYQDPLIRTLCVVCGAADGSYPCTALVEANALADALGDDR